jgi:hypothetical protein
MHLALYLELQPLLKRLHHRLQQPEQQKQDISDGRFEKTQGTEAQSAQTQPLV